MRPVKLVALATSLALLLSGCFGFTGPVNTRYKVVISWDEGSVQSQTMAPKNVNVSPTPAIFTFVPGVMGSEEIGVTGEVYDDQGNLTDIAPSWTAARASVRDRQAIKTAIKGIEMGRGSIKAEAPDGTFATVPVYVYGHAGLIYPDGKWDPLRPGFDFDAGVPNGDESTADIWMVQNWTLSVPGGISPLDGGTLQDLASYTGEPEGLTYQTSIQLTKPLETPLFIMRTREGTLVKLRVYSVGGINLDSHNPDKAWNIGIHYAVADESGVFDY